MDTVVQRSSRRVIPLLYCVFAAFTTQAEPDKEVGVALLFKAESETVSEAALPHLIEALSQQSHPAAVRSRIAEINLETIVSESPQIILNAFDNTQMKAIKYRVKRLYKWGAFGWYGYIDSEEFPLSNFDKPLPEEIDKATADSLKRGMLGITLYAEQWSRDKSTGEFMRSRFHGGLDSGPYDRILRVIKPSDNDFETFYAVTAEYSKPLSGVFTVIQPVVGDPKYHIVYEVPARDFLPSGDDTILTEGKRERREESDFGTFKAEDRE